MARRFITFIIAFAIPLITLLSHPELRRILIWDALILTFKSPSQAMELLPKPTDPLYRGIRDAEKLEGREEWLVYEMEDGERRLAYERLYRQTGEVWVGVFGLRYWMQAVTSERIENEKQRQDAERLLKLATELSERDKDNAFPMLAKAYALFELGRDDEALSTFHEASLRPNYRTYDGEWLRLKSPKIFTAEERLTRAFAFLLPHLSALREMARRVIRYSANAEKKGDFKRALELAEDVVRVGTKLREQGFWLIDLLVGISIQSIAFAGETRKLTEAERQRYAQSPEGELLKISARRFAEFARKHGRKDLAEWTLKEAEESARAFNLTRQYPQEGFLFGDLKHHDGLRLVNTRLTGFALLLSAFALAVIGLISAAFLWRIPVAIDSYSPVTATLIVAGLPIAAIIWGMVGALQGEIWDVMQTETLFVAIYLPFAILLLLFAVCFVPALWQLKGKVKWQTIALLIAIAAFAGIFTAAISNIPIFKAIATLLTILLLLALVALIVIVFWLKFKLDVPNLGIRILSAVAIGIMVCVLLFVMLGLGIVFENLRWRPYEVEFMPLFVVIALAVSAFVFFIVWGVWARFGRSDYRPICQSSLARLKGASVLLLLICWWGYAVVEFSSLPLRAKIHRALDDLSAYGELALIQRVVSSTPYQK
ncbi:MAG: hypothetical protein RMK89_07985 [Armatimonadota bacterium]|nr:hypothetical protein [Armatimonadota bacterium]MDW8143384.1 hypothetical protein [Armatimonadota bacterium]